MSESFAAQGAAPVQTDADAALRFVGSDAPPMTKEDEQRLVTKIDLFLIPLLCMIDSIFDTLHY